jgi:putative sterol carrier protein
MVEKPTKEEFPLVMEKTFGFVGDLTPKEGLAALSDVVETICFEFPDYEKKYFLTVNSEGELTRSTEPPKKVDCTITMNSDTLHSLMTGKTSETSAYMSGKLKVKGISPLKLQKILPKLGPLDEYYEKAIAEVKGG